MSDLRQAHEQAFLRGAEGDAFEARGTLADLQNPLRSALSMDHSQARIEDSDDAGIGFAFFAILARKNGCRSRRSATPGTLQGVRLSI